MDQIAPPHEETDAWLDIAITRPPEATSNVGGTRTSTAGFCDAASLHLSGLRPNSPSVRNEVSANDVRRAACTRELGAKLGQSDQPLGRRSADLFVGNRQIGPASSLAWPMSLTGRKATSLEVAPDVNRMFARRLQ